MSGKKLDALAEEILQIFKERGFDSSYIEEKQLELTSLSRFSVIRWCSSLDAICLSELASK